mmetsp:Transcript_55266/g.91527  ORF Transcript_55266/g.91527 Transcript_55266/m.91527 type:complete len:100 (+) Transcript_55266:27-326(+)
MGVAEHSHRVPDALTLSEWNILHSHRIPDALTAMFSSKPTIIVQKEKAVACNDTEKIIASTRRGKTSVVSAQMSALDVRQRFYKAKAQTKRKQHNSVTN